MVAEQVGVELATRLRDLALAGAFPPDSTGAMVLDPRQEQDYSNAYLLLAPEHPLGADHPLIVELVFLLGRTPLRPVGPGIVAREPATPYLEQWFESAREFGRAEERRRIRTELRELIEEIIAPTSTGGVQ